VQWFQLSASVGLMNGKILFHRNDDDRRTDQSTRTAVTCDAVFKLTYVSFSYVYFLCCICTEINMDDDDDDYDGDEQLML